MFLFTMNSYEIFDDFFLILPCVLIYMLNLKQYAIYFALPQQECVDVNLFTFCFERKFDCRHVEVQKNVAAKL